MSRKIVLILSFLIMAGIVSTSSCSDPKPTQGSLGITVLRGSDGSPLQSELIYISKSYQDLENHIYLDSNWTDANGSYRFHQRDPGIYWYGANHWRDFGAARVMNGIDVDVILWVNTPDTTIHK